FRTRATAYLNALKERSSAQQTAQVPPVAPLLVSPTGQPISSQAQQVAAAMAPSPLAQIEEIEKRPMKLAVDEAILKTSIMNVISEIEGRGLHLAGAGVPGQAGGVKEFVLTREKEEAIAEAI